MSTSFTVVAKKGREKKSTKARRKLMSSSGDVMIPKASFGKMGKIFAFKRRAAPTQIVQQANAETLGALSFRLDLTLGYTDFTPLFDAYRIRYVEVKFRPRFNMGAVSSTSSMIYPRLFTVIDLNDATSAASTQAMEEFQTCRIVNFDKPVTRAFRPCPSTPLYNGSFSAFGMGNVDQWCDVSSPDVQYYGVKYGIESGIFGQADLQAWAVDIIYYLEFRYSK